MTQTEALQHSRNLLAAMLRFRVQAKRQGLSGPAFSQYMDECVAAWIWRTFDTKPEEPRDASVSPTTPGT